MLLSDFEFKGSYNRIDDDIAGDFYIPCMMNSISYDRISGFFGSTIYVIAWKALKAFLSNAGTMRIICSPIISPEDVAAMEEGNAAQMMIYWRKRWRENLKKLHKMKISIFHQGCFHV